MNISGDDIEPEEIIPDKESDLGEYTKRIMTLLMINSSKLQKEKKL